MATCYQKQGRLEPAIQCISRIIATKELTNDGMVVFGREFYGVIVVFVRGFLWCYC